MPQATLAEVARSRAKVLLLDKYMRHQEINGKLKILEKPLKGVVAKVKCRAGEIKLVAMTSQIVLSPASSSLEIDGKCMGVV